MNGNQAECWIPDRLIIDTDLSLALEMQNYFFLTSQYATLSTTR